MTQNANILSFNEVKARGASAPRTVSSKRTSRARHAYQADSSFSRSGANLRGSGGHAYQSSRFAFDDFTSGIAADYRGFNSGFRSAPATDFRNASVTSSTGFRSTSATGTQGVASRYPHQGVASSDVIRHDSRNQTTRSRSSRYTSHDARQNSRAMHQGRTSEKEGLFSGLQKRFRSAKAERQFDQTIGARERKAQADAEQAQASRAAVYEMRMGATHRKSARMQNNEGKKSGFGGFGFALPFGGGGKSLSVAATRGIVALAAVVFTVFMLYPSCQNYYNETRQLQQLEAQYQALTDYNMQMQSQIDYLNTDEGLEEYARSELGWIRQDEHMVTVEGVESSVDGSTQSSTTHSPLNEDIPAPDTWYSGVLDVFFGYGQ